MPSLIEKLGLNKLSLEDRLALIDELLSNVALEMDKPRPGEEPSPENERRPAPADKKKTLP